MNLLERLAEYQERQKRHDLDYHSDIVKPGKNFRLKHIALHFSKYAYPLMQGSSHPGYMKVFTDTFVMTMSASNVLEMTFTSTPEKLAIEDSCFFQEYVFFTSLFSKACESTDHQEDYPTDDTWMNCIDNLLRICVSEADRMGVDIVANATDRLQHVEKMIDLRRSTKQKRL